MGRRQTPQEEEERKAAKLDRDTQYLQEEIENYFRKNPNSGLRRRLFSDVLPEHQILQDQREAVAPDAEQEDGPVVMTPGFTQHK